MKKEYDIDKYHIIEIDMKDAIKEGLVTYKDIERSVNIHCLKCCIKDNLLMTIVVLIILFAFVPFLTNKLCIVIELLMAWMDSMLILLNIHKNLKIRNNVIDKLRGEINND